MSQGPLLPARQPLFYMPANFRISNHKINRQSRTFPTLGLIRFVENYEYVISLMYIGDNLHSATSVTECNGVLNLLIILDGRCSYLSFILQSIDHPCSHLSTLPRACAHYFAWPRYCHTSIHNVACSPSHLKSRGNYITASPCVSAPLSRSVLQAEVLNFDSCLRGFTPSFAM